MATKTTALRVIEPATEKVMAELQEATVEEADAAVARAKAAYPGWKRLCRKDLPDLMRRIASAIGEHAEELAQLEARNVGKQPDVEQRDLGRAQCDSRDYAGAPERLVGK